MTASSFVQAIGLWLTSLVTKLLRLTGKRAGVVVAYHAVSEPGGDRRHELVPARDVESLRREIGFMKRNYELVPAGALVDAVAARRRFDRFPASITFDDDLPEHVEITAPTLADERVPATFFVSGARKGRRWWQALQAAVDRTSVDEVWDRLALSHSSTARPREIHELADRIRLLDPGQRAEVEVDLAAAAGEDASEPIDVDRFAELARAGFEIGFHTLEHVDLVTLDQKALQVALEAGREDLARACGRPVELIAYPHGSADDRVAATASAAGYRMGFTIAPRAVTPTSEPMLLGRLLSDRLSSGKLLLGLAMMLIRS